MTIPICKRIIDLNLAYWSKEVISRIASALGRPIRMDNTTSEIRLKYAHVLVEVDVDFKYPDKVQVIRSNNNREYIELAYEYKPKARSVYKPKTLINGFVGE